MSEGPRRRNHVVTAEYQRRFARPDGTGRHFVRLFDLRDRVDRGEVEVCKALKKKDFSVVKPPGGPVDDVAEREWARLEATSMPHLRGLNPDFPLTMQEQAACKTMVALHLSRSLASEHVFDGAWDSNMARFPARVEGKATVEAAFVEECGRAAEPGEIAALAAAHVAAQKATNVMFVQHQIDEYNKLLDYLIPRPIAVTRLVSLRKRYFVTTDTPVMLIQGALGARLGSDIKFGHEDVIIMPLSRRVLLSIGPRTFPPEVNETVAAELNEAMINEAFRFAVAHPDTDIAASAPTLHAIASREAEAAS